MSLAFCDGRRVPAASKTSVGNFEHDIFFEGRPIKWLKYRSIRNSARDPTFDSDSTNRFQFVHVFFGGFILLHRRGLLC